MKLNPTYSPDDINFIHDEAQIFVESILNHLDDNITPTLGDDGKYHYVYLTINKINGFFYIGKRTVSDDLEKGQGANARLKLALKHYLGGGIKIQEAVRQYGKDSFLRFIVKFYRSSADAFKAEESLVNSIVVERYSKHLGCMYNLRTGGTGGIGGTGGTGGIGGRNKKLKIKKDSIIIFIDSLDLLKYMLEGYRLTCSSAIIVKKHGDKIISKALNFDRTTGRQKRVNQSVLLSYLQDGWIIGRSHLLKVQEAFIDKNQ